DIRGNVRFLSEYFQRSLALARTKKCGLALMHSHPAVGWQEMSNDDIRAEESHAPAVLGATQLPLVALTAGSDGAWSARFWLRTGTRAYRRHWCETVRVAGERLAVTYYNELRPI